jgi:hypothetical protein
MYMIIILLLILCMQYAYYILESNRVPKLSKLCNRMINVHVRWELTCQQLCVYCVNVRVCVLEREVGEGL